MRPPIIAGILPVSLIDYPRKIACVLFTQGCNLRCPWCHNARLIPFHTEPSCERFRSENILEFLRSRVGQLDGVVITGGEPLLQSSLPRLLSDIRKLGFSVKLDTNGTQSNRLRILLEEGLLDYVAMDVKAPLQQPARYEIAVGVHADTESIETSAHIIAEMAPSGEFRTTVLPGFHELETLAQMIDGLPAHVPFFLQAFVPKDAATAHWRTTQPHTAGQMERLTQQLNARFPHRAIALRN